MDSSIEELFKEHQLEKYREDKRREIANKLNALIDPTTISDDQLKSVACCIIEAVFEKLSKDQQRLVLMNVKPNTYYEWGCYIGWKLEKYVVPFENDEELFKHLDNMDLFYIMFKDKISDDFLVWLRNNGYKQFVNFYESKHNTTEKMFIFYYTGVYIDNGHIHKYVNIAKTYQESLSYLDGKEVRGFPRVYEVKPGVLFNQYLGECCDDDCEDD
jgi:hypothetical protein